VVCVNNVLGSMSNCKIDI